MNDDLHSGLYDDELGEDMSFNDIGLGSDDSDVEER